MKLRELTARVGDQLDVPATTVRQVLDTAIDVLLADLVRTGHLDWRGFGSFAVRTYAPRKIHNPATGAIIELPVRRTVTFKPSARLRSKLELDRTRRSTARRAKKLLNKVVRRTI